MIRVIIVDDHPVVRRGLKQIITAEEDMEIVGEAENARDAISLLRRTACEWAGIIDVFRGKDKKCLYDVGYLDLKGFPEGGDLAAMAFGK